MRIKHAAVSGLVIFCYIMASIILCMITEALLLYIIDRIILVPYPVQTIIRIVIYTVGGIALIGFLGYHEGYREATCSLSETFIGTFLSAVVHLILSLLFHFQGFISGGVRFVASLIYHGWDITHELTAQTPTWFFIVCFGFYMILYATTLALCKQAGSTKRLADRDELLRQKNEVPPANQ